jgi:hypothetical protein
MTCNYFLCYVLKQAIDIRGYILDQLKSLLIANYYCFLLDKHGSDLRRGE